MATSISSLVISLGKLLHAGDSYIVPPYQRNYSWEETQYGLFWEDISKTFSSAARDYFLGSVVIDNSRAPDLVVIDGQQRLITTSVLISALRSHLRAAGESRLAALIETDFLVKSDYRQQVFAPCLILNKSDQFFYDSYIFHSRPATEIYRLAGDETLPPSNRLIAECFRFMHRRIAALCADDRRSVADLANAIIASLNHRVFLIRIDVKNDYDAFMLFETLNDRGLELSEADLLKNHLFSVSGARLYDTQSNWDVMEQHLGNERLFKFVRHHWLSTRGHISERGLYSDIKTQIAAPDGAVAYSAELCTAAELYAALSSARHHLWATLPNDHQAVIRDHIDTLEILRPEQVFIVLLAALEADRRGVRDLLRMLISFIFRYSTICNLSPSNILQPFINAAREIRRTGRVSPAELFAAHLSKLYPDDSQFQSAFSRKTVRNNALARYILAAINDHLSPHPSLRTRIDPFATDLEHILPKRYAEIWTINRKDFPGRAEKYVHSLGNMTLISAKLNRDLGNADFATKKRVFAQDCLAITRRVIEAERWTAEEIKNRQNWLASIAVKIWRCPEG